VAVAAEIDALATRAKAEDERRHGQRVALSVRRAGPGVFDGLFPGPDHGRPIALAAGISCENQRALISLWTGYLRILSFGSARSRFFTPASVTLVSVSCSHSS
jgi:hypothetical protein